MNRPQIFSIGRLIRRLQTSLRLRLSLMVTAVLILVVLASALITVVFVQRTERVKWDGRQTDAVRSAASALESFLSQVEDSVRFTSLMPRSELDLEPGALNDVLNLNPGLLEIVRTDAHGQLVASAYRGAPVLASPANSASLARLANEVSGEDMTYTEITAFPGVSDSYLIYVLHVPTGGVVIGRLRMDLLWQIVSEIHFGETGKVFVVTREGKILVHTDRAWANTRVPAQMQAILVNGSGTAEFTDLQSVPVVAAYAPVEGTNWIVVAQMQGDEAYSETRTALLVLPLGALVVGVLLVTTMLRLLEHAIFEPVERLREGTERIGRGQLDYRIAVPWHDEIGRVATSFNSMAEELRRTMEGLAERTTQLGLANERLQSELFERLSAEEALRESEAKYRNLANEISDGLFITDRDGALTYANGALARIVGFDQPAAIVGRNLLDFVPPDELAELTQMYRSAMSSAASPALVSTEVLRGDGARAFVEIKPQVILTDGTPAGARGVVRDITERHLAEMETQRRLTELEAVNHLSTAMRKAQTTDELVPIVLETTLELMKAAGVTMRLHDPEDDQLACVGIRGEPRLAQASLLPPEKPGEGVAGRVFSTGQSWVVREFRTDVRVPEKVRALMPPEIGGAVVPIRAADVVIGTLGVNVNLPRELTPDEVRLLTILAEIAGNAIQRSELGEQTERRLRHLAALGDVDRTIISSVDVQASLAMLLAHVVGQLQVDAADVLLYDSSTLNLEYAAGRGFRTMAPRNARFRLGQGPAGRAALDRCTVRLPDPAKAGDGLDELVWNGEGFVSYYGVPLVAKGQVKGVLEIFQRLPLDPDQEWLDFLDTLARQCAIAIDNASLFSGLQQSNAELARAYDETIEGWSRALDLRDKETEGHTLRVTEMTLRLAKALALPDAELVHIRRGALLHDIGKMGIPDVILLKPGALTPAEWEIMRRHPALAFELLSPISYLRPSLDIPYCHHEKWDGTGYPRRLKGPQIPLSARLFAAVDVWDALSSDRPYRGAWDAERVREYIRSQAGMHFDPKVVELFLQILEQDQGKE